MLFALDGTAILVSMISTVGVLGVGFFGYIGIKAQLTKTTDMNTSQHGEVASAVRSMGSTLKDVDATLSLLVSTQGFPLFKNTAEGNLFWVNPAAMELLGADFDHLMHMHSWPKLIHEEDRAMVLENWRTQIETGRPNPAITYRYVHPVTGRVTRVRGMSRAILGEDGEVQEWVSMVVPLTSSLEEVDGR